MPAPTSQPLLVLLLEAVCAGRQIVDGEVVAADPTAAGLAIKEPVAIGHTEPGSQGRDPSIRCTGPRPLRPFLSPSADRNALSD